jgi:hypothetical protein
MAKQMARTVMIDIGLGILPGSKMFRDTLPCAIAWVFWPGQQRFPE